MKHNMGSADRVIRIVAGVAVIGAGVYYQSLLGVIGVVFIATALMRFCPPYALLGINTCSIKKD